MVHHKPEIQEEGKPHKDRDLLPGEKQPEAVRTGVDVWDEKRREWLKAKNNNLTWLQEVVEITWTGVTQNTTDIAPDTDKIIDIRFARSITVLTSTLDTEVTNASTDVDINVEVCVDEAEAIWTTVPYAEGNIGDNAVDAFLVNPGPRKMRLRLDENNSGAAGAIARVLVRY